MEKTILPQSQSDAAGVPRTPLRVLIADDSENDALIVLHALRKAGYEPLHERVWTAHGMQVALQKQSWEIIISDYEMPSFGGFEALQLLKESGQEVPFILVSAVVSEETAVAAMKAGAHDYIMKRKLARLGPAIERELREAQTRAAKKAAEAALRHSEDQLRQAQKLEAIARLAAGVAHDFNNILTAISGHSELLLRQLDASDSRRKNAEQIEKCAYLAAALTRQLLTFSRKQAIEPRLLDLNDVVKNIERMLRRLIGEDIELGTSLDASAGSVKADPSQLEQVIMNLTVNARDAMPNGGKVLISTANATIDKTRLKESLVLNPGKYVVLAITDTGTGMTSEVKAHLFEPFFTTKPPGKGTGLGLATCFGIVKQSSGHIDVESEPGKGTTFKLYFPLVEDAVAPVDPETLTRPARGGTETVLLVEDEAFVRELGVTTLREQGYTVFEAGNGEEGLRVAREHPGRIDLVFTDVVMPVMGGKAMADALRAFRPETKVLFSSGYSEEVIGDHGVLQPGIEFLQKPYLPATLTRRVREVLDHAAPVNAPIC
ncbi:MAG TPA: response regulator [Candidatus Limnocylindrales bacterium]|nr:response regulator [Candidatus Limnocylindrales bacterium]